MLTVYGRSEDGGEPTCCTYASCAPANTVLQYPPEVSLEMILIYQEGAGLLCQKPAKHGPIRVLMAPVNRLGRAIAASAVRC